MVSTQIIHFATHGRFDSLRPEFSGLVLSLVDEQAQNQPGYFLSQEIYNLKLNADPAYGTSRTTAPQRS